MNDISTPAVLKPVRGRKGATVKPPFAAPAAALPAVVDAPSFAEAVAAVAQPASLPVPVPVPAAAPAVVATVNALDEGTTMATTADAAFQATDTAFQATDKVQSLIADAQTRAREAMEKGSKMYEEMGSFAKGNVEAVMASSRVAASGFEALGQDMAAYGKRSFEEATSVFKSFATVKSPTELFQLQSDYARSAFDGLVAEGSKMSEKVLKLAGDVAQPLSNRLAVAAEKVKVGL